MSKESPDTKQTTGTENTSLPGFEIWHESIISFDELWDRMFNGLLPPPDSPEAKAGFAVRNEWGNSWGEMK